MSGVRIELLIKFKTTLTLLRFQKLCSEVKLHLWACAMETWARIEEAFFQRTDILLKFFFTKMIEKTHLKVNKNDSAEFKQQQFCKNVNNCCHGANSIKLIAALGRYRQIFPS